MIKYKYYVGDFETTVYDGQLSTQVWASACVEMYTEDVHIFHSIEEQLQYLIDLKQNLICYFHNLKFDGNFWLSFLMKDMHLDQAYRFLNEEHTQVEFLSDKDMPNNSFKYMISDMGQWYSITIKIHNKFIVFRDSLKLLPFSVKKIGKSFATKHKKLEMEYKGLRYAGCEITEEEQKYIANDVLVVKEALEIMFNEGHNKMTIGSCCLNEYKNNIIGEEDYANLFPDMTEFSIDPTKYTYDNADAYIRKSYKGGWCYCARGKENKVYHNGTTADVNSLYPSMMSSQSGNVYPTGKPKFWQGDYIPDICKKPNIYYFVRIRTRFYLKKDKLPFIQIKGSYLYKGTDMLETSDVQDKKTGEYHRYYRDDLGNIHDSQVTLTLTMTDFELMKDHYELVDCVILDGCYFMGIVGIFDQYIDKYKKIKQNSTGALRELAKLFLNNLYGKMASSQDSSFKVAYLKEDGVVGFYNVEENNKQAGYIPVGSAITSYARNFTIRTAQANYYGKDQRGFIYADTDSIHCDLRPEELKGLTVDDKEFCCWKLESCWDIGWFVRQKTYIEHVTHENLKEIEEPYYNIKCAGMPDRCKEYFRLSMMGVPEEELKNYDEEIQEFLKKKRTVEDFTIGLKIWGKLVPHRILGGVLLAETTYEMR